MEEEPPKPVSALLSPRSSTNLTHRGITTMSTVTTATMQTEINPQGAVADGDTADLHLSNRNFTTSRKVQKLLDITVHDNFRDLVLYMNDAVPEFLEDLLPPTDPSPTDQEKTPIRSKSQETPQKQQLGVAAASSIALRTALEGRVVDLHRYFLQEWSLLNDVFEEASDLVTKLQSDSETLQTTLDTHAAQAEEFVALMTTLQAELSLVQQREHEMREFQEKYRFGSEEQRVLDEGPVDATYLDVLKRAQATHRKCRDLLLSREYYQSAAAVMDITYSAIMKGTEKVARYLMSASSTSPGGAMSASEVAFGNAGVGGDSPELTSFYLRCVHFLREESPTQWVTVVEEVTRLRRAAVLRQYFHLMTTGSATTSPGTYRAGDSPVASSSATHNKQASAGAGGARPLEIEIGNPIFFFSSLFAWLHQVIVDEDDFFTAFWGATQVESSTQQTIGTNSSDLTTFGGITDTSAAGAGGENTTRDTQLSAENELDMSRVNKAALLDSVFEVLCKHIQGVLDGVLERFLRSASSHQDDNHNPSKGNGGRLSGRLGPMGLTGNIARLLSVATGRPAAASLMSTSSGIDGNGRAMRYKHVMTRAQQEAIVTSTLSSLTSGLRTAHKLLQLFSYYSYSTFSALLGREAALTRLVTDDAKLQLLRIYHTIAKQLADHALDSVAGVLTQSATLRRLASSAATAAEASQATAAAATTTTTTVDTSSRATSVSLSGVDNANLNQVSAQDVASSYHVTEYLFETITEDVVEAGDEAHADADSTRSLSLSSSISLRSLGASLLVNRGETMSVDNNFSGGQGSAALSMNRSYHRSHLSNHRLQAAELWRVLRTMILPVPPEIEEYLRVLQSTLVETEKQMEIMESVRAMLSKNPSSTMNNNITPSDGNDGVSYQEQFFMVVIQYALSFPLFIARQATTNTGLDEPCKLTLQLNTMAALEEVLAQHLSLLEMWNDASGHATPLSNVVPERMQQLTKELITSLSKCAVRHYFYRKPRRTSTTMEESGRSISDNNGPMMDSTELDGATMAAQLSELYGSIAASGRVYIPLISAIRTTRLQEQVLQGVLHALCTVYEERYAQLMEMCRSGVMDQATIAELSEMEPRKLRILLDVSAPSV